MRRVGDGSLRDHSFRLERGENALLSGHVMSCTIDRENGLLSGKVEASQRKEEQSIKIFFTVNEVTEALCSCPIGRYGRCHHIAALLLYANRNVSTTDVSCSWVHKTKAGHNNEGDPVEHFYPSARPHYKAIPASLSASEISVARANLHVCKGAALNIKWLTDPEPTEPAAQQESASDVNVDDVPALKIPPIEDIILSPSFLKCATVEEKVKCLTEGCALTSEDISLIAEVSKGQSSGDIWATLHTHVMTASTNNRSCKTLLTSITGKNWFSGGAKYRGATESERAMNWGKDNEPTARQCFMNANPQYSVEETGLWFHPSGVLGASPDGLVNEDGVLEIKCPYSMRSVKDIKTHLQIQYAAEKCSKKKNPEHDHYHQLQGQMLCTGRDVCHYAIWTSEDFVSLSVHRDEDWMTNKVSLLLKTYFKRYVPYAFFSDN